MLITHAQDFDAPILKSDTISVSNQQSFPQHMFQEHQENQENQEETIAAIARD